MATNIKPTNKPTNINHHHLMAMLSPSFPTGGFAYSHGLECAIYNKIIHNAQTLEAYLLAILQYGGGWNDAIFFCHAYHGRNIDADRINELALALAGSKERYQETIEQGKAFSRAVNKLYGKAKGEAIGEVIGEGKGNMALPIIVAQTGRKLKIDLDSILPLFIHSQLANLISVGVRLIPIGQIEGQEILQNLFTSIEDIAQKAMLAELDDLGSCAMIGDIMAMQHEDMTTRIFRT